MSAASDLEREDSDKNKDYRGKNGRTNAIAGSPKGGAKFNKNTPNLQHQSL